LIFRVWLSKASSVPTIPRGPINKVTCTAPLFRWRTDEQAQRILVCTNHLFNERRANTQFSARYIDVSNSSRADPSETDIAGPATQSRLSLCATRVIVFLASDSRLIQSLHLTGIVESSSTGQAHPSLLGACCSTCTGIDPVAVIYRFSSL
jgi:hypothetical protein